MYDDYNEFDEEGNQEFYNYDQDQNPDEPYNYENFNNMQDGIIEEDEFYDQGDYSQQNGQNQSYTFMNNGGTQAQFTQENDFGYQQEDIVDYSQNYENFEYQNLDYGQNQDEDFLNVNNGSYKSYVSPQMQQEFDYCEKFSGEKDTKFIMGQEDFCYNTMDLENNDLNETVGTNQNLKNYGSYNKSNTLET